MTCRIANQITHCFQLVLGWSTPQSCIAHTCESQAQRKEEGCHKKLVSPWLQVISTQNHFQPSLFWRVKSLARPISQCGAREGSNHQLDWKKKKKGRPETILLHLERSSVGLNGPSRAYLIGLQIEVCPEVHPNPAHQGMGLQFWGRQTGLEQ